MIIPLEKRKRIQTVGERGEDNDVKIIYHSRVNGNVIAVRECGKLARGKNESNEAFAAKVHQHVREFNTRKSNG